MKSLEISHQNIIKLFGPFDRSAKLVEDAMHVRLRAEDGKLVISGENEECEAAALCLYESLLRLIGMGYPVNEEKIEASIPLAIEGRSDDIIELSTEAVAFTAKGEAIRCKTVGQRHYVKTICKKALTFGVGPAGTGKTFLAVALAAKEYKAGNVEKIILTRPAIEVGEKLGFLPGDLQDKVDPYLRPLYDALEIAPLAYMRGRTLSKAFVILDEAQNTTEEQMKMFLTRMGEGSRVVVNGDPGQSDLPKNVKRGLLTALDVLDGIEEIGVCRLTGRDVVRNRLVRIIVNAYDKHEKEEKQALTDAGEEKNAD